MSRRTISIASLASLVLLAPVGCTKTGADAQPPADPTSAVEQDCVAATGRIKPLVVDWDPAARGELDAAMQASVVVVKRDCGAVEILPGCRVDGSYSYAGLDRHEQVVQLETIDDVHANVPAGSATFGSEIQSGGVIDLATVLVGRHSTTITNLSAASLIGECEGATHFVRSVSRGAFALAKGSKGQAAAVAELFGAGSPLSAAGELAACMTTTASTSTAPAECQAPVRIDLVPIVGDDQTAAKHTQASKIAAIEDPCAPGYVFGAGMCARPSADRPQLCDPRDPADCEAQCAKGDVASCFNHGRLLAPSSGSAPGPSQAPLSQACEAGVAEACTLLGELLWYDPNHDAQEITMALELVNKGCEGGIGYACDLAGDIVSDKSLPSFDLARAFAFYSRACDLGEAVGCTFAAVRLFRGEGVAKDAGAGLARLERSCQAGSISECGDIGSILAQGKYGATKDQATASTYLGRACMADPAWCEEAGKVATDVGDADSAKRFYARDCELHPDGESCSKI